MSATVADALDCAADYLTEYGWRQGGGVGPNGQGCVMVALMVPEHQGRAWAAKAFREWTGELSISAWNDAPERTADEVITALRACAAAQRESP